MRWGSAYRDAETGFVANRGGLTDPVTGRTMGNVDDPGGPDVAGTNRCDIDADDLRHPSNTPASDPYSPPTAQPPYSNFVMGAAPACCLETDERLRGRGCREAPTGDRAGSTVGAVIVPKDRCGVCSCAAFNRRTCAVKCECPARDQNNVDFTATWTCYDDFPISSIVRWSPTLLPGETCAQACNRTVPALTQPRACNRAR